MHRQGAAQQGTTQQGAGTLPQEYRQPLHSVSQAIQVCGWCADQCIRAADPNMVECIQYCEDVVELGEALLAIAPRSSPYTADLVRAFERAARACAQECGQHGHAHCQECASVLPQAAQSVRQLSGGEGQMPQGGQQMQQW